jgi:hypothetical protein
LSNTIGRQPKYRQPKKVTKGYSIWELEESCRPKLFYSMCRSSI